LEHLLQRLASDVGSTFKQKDDPMSFKVQTTKSKEWLSLGFYAMISAFTAVTTSRVAEASIISTRTNSAYALPQGVRRPNFAKTWPQNPETGVAEIPICIMKEASSTQQKSTRWWEYGLIHAPNPGIDEVIGHVRAAMESSWGRTGTVQFVGWKYCEQLLDSERKMSIRLKIHPDVKNESAVGTDAWGGEEASTKFKPWGNESRCIGYNWANARMEYSFDCVKQYAIHELGHAIGFDHEMDHPLRTATCVNSFSGTAGQISANPTSEPDSFIINPNSFDPDSMMLYSNGGACGNNEYGIRFGGTNLSPTDVSGLAFAYPPREKSNSTLDGFTRCGKEGEEKYFDTPTSIAYGANGKFNFKHIPSGWITLNNGTFGDPTPGIYKYAYCRINLDHPEGWRHCGYEGQSIAVKGTMDVRYGANSSYRYALGVTGRILLNNSNFGDPIPGVFKYGYCRPSEKSEKNVQPSEKNVQLPGRVLFKGLRR